LILRRLAPAAAPISARDLWHSLLGAFSRDSTIVAVRRTLGEALGVRHVFLVSSGRAALTLILKALAARSRRRGVVVAAYTCYSVPAAVRRAGLDVILCDVNPSTFDFDINVLRRLLVTQQPLCVVATHLFGKTIDIPRILTLCADHGVAVIDDAAQALIPAAKVGPPGPAADACVYSFGRGKGVTCVHGGAVVTAADDLAEAIAREYESLPLPSFFRQCVTMAQALLLVVFLRPRLYWIPARLPFLKLGETQYDPCFPIAKMTGAEAGLLRRWRTRLEEASRARTHTANAIIGLLPGLARLDQTGLLRFPVVCQSRPQRDHLLRESAKRGLGLSMMYPESLNRVGGMGATAEAETFPGAELLAERLLAVPVHPFVSEADVLQIGALLRPALGPSRSGR